MTLDGSFVLSPMINTAKYAFFEAYSQVMGASAQGSLANPKFVRHLPVMLDLRAPLVQVIVENEFLFVAGQQLQTLGQALISITSNACLCLALRQHVRRDLFTTSILENDVSCHTVKVSGRIANVAPLQLRQSLYHSIDRLVGVVFRITQALGDEDAYQPGPNCLVSCSCFFAIRIEPLKQSIKWFLGDGQLSTNSLELGDR
jgi:hypothetical protein